MGGGNVEVSVLFMITVVDLTVAAVLYQTAISASTPGRANGT